MTPEQAVAYGRFVTACKLLRERERLFKEAQVEYAQAIKAMSDAAIQPPVSDADADLAIPVDVPFKDVG